VAKEEPIRRILLADGKTKRYRLVVDIGDDPVTGKRRQFTGTYTKLKDAKAELARIRHERNTGTFVRPDKERTLNDELDDYLAGLRGKEEATLASYRHAVKPARAFMGERRLQELEKKDFDEFVEWMSTQGRARSTSPRYGKGHGPRGVQLTLSRLQAALDIAVAEKRIAYNPVRLVERPKKVKPEHELWTDAEEERFFAHVAGDRLVAVIELFARGLRPEELCGIRWGDIDPAQRTAHTGLHVRTEVDGRPVEKRAKTKAGERVLPLDDALVRALEDWRLTQLAERRRALSAYRDGDYVLCDETGRPFQPNSLRRYMHRLMEAAGVRRVTPYEAMRHAAGSRMSRAGVAPQVIAAWMGHTNPSFTADNYMHARPQDLAAARDALERGKREQGRENGERVGESSGQSVSGGEPRRGGGRRGKVAGARRRAVGGGSAEGPAQ
jgi:integrase